MNTQLNTMHIFVYGTLLTGFDNTFRQLLESQSTFLGSATIVGRLYDLGNYPGLILSEEPTEIVFGEVYQLKNEFLLKELDLYENYRRNDSSSLFIRSVQRVALKQGGSVHAFLYTYNKSIDNAIRIIEGDYRTYLST